MGELEINDSLLCKWRSQGTGPRRPGPRHLPWVREELRPG